MSLISSLQQAVRAWRRRRGGAKAPKKRAGVALEQLDHRQLLAVNFTGNVLIDFPDTLVNRGVIRVDGTPPGFAKPIIPPQIQPIIQVSGFELSAVRASYTPSDDTLSVGIEQPRNPKDPLGRAVIAGDSDNNGNSGTVDPAITAIPGFNNFTDFPNMEGPESMGVLIDLNTDGQPDLIAGFPSATTLGPKPYEVANVVPGSTTDFGVPRPQNTGTYFLQNNPNTPNFELQITNFSQVYKEKTGKDLTPDSPIGFGAFGAAGEGGISEAFLPPQYVLARDASPVVPPVCPPCPPLNPPVIINIHEHRHVNTAHPERVRAYLFGTSAFDVRAVNQDSVRLGAPGSTDPADAQPVDRLFRDVNHDGFLDEVIVFRGDQIKGLQPGFTRAELRGQLNDGQVFASSGNIFNRDPTSYKPNQMAQVRARESARQVATERVEARNGASAHSASAPTGPVVSIPRRNHRPQANTVRIPGVGIPSVPVPSVSLSR
ncbi:MAG: hypothetical protein ABI353_14415 [Isosphaeraceae bacterium]